MLLADVFCHVVDYGHFNIWLMMLQHFYFGRFGHCERTNFGLLAKSKLVELQIIVSLSFCINVCVCRLSYKQGFLAELGNGQYVQSVCRLQ